MKVLKIIALASLCALTAVPASAGGFDVSGSLFDGDYFGVGARKTFELGGDISQLTGGATFYFKDAWFAFDADYHFVVNPANPSRFYPLVGLELATDFDNAELGANLGGGVDFMATRTLAAFAEAKFVVSDWDGFVVTAGVKF